MSLPPVDLLVFAPHPDDETIGTGGVIQQTLAAGKKVRVAFITNGDGYPRAASDLLNKPIAQLTATDYIALAAARQREAVAAGTVLGLSPSSLVFLGYPDAAMPAVYGNHSLSPVASPFTQERSTYGPTHADYHSLAHGQPGTYMRSSALADVVEVLRDSRPAVVYVTDRADTHPDHETTFNLVTDAAAAIGFAGAVRTFVVHSGPDQVWPWPRGAAPDSPFEAHAINGSTYPIGVSWPPPVRVPLTTSECALKLKAISKYASQVAIDREYLESSVKSEEVFWESPARP